MFKGEILFCVQRKDCVLCAEETLCPVFRGAIFSCVQTRDCVQCSEERLCLVESQDICLVETQDMCCVESVLELGQAHRISAQPGQPCPAVEKVRKTKVRSMV